MNDFHKLLDTSNTTLPLTADDIDTSREFIMVDARKALLAAADRIRPGADLSLAEIKDTLDRLNQTIDRLLVAMQALRESLQRNVVH
jgi:hypothetical protein